MKLFDDKGIIIKIALLLLLSLKLISITSFSLHKQNINNGLFSKRCKNSSNKPSSTKLWYSEGKESSIEKRPASYKKYISSSKQMKLEEEERREGRKKDVIIGKTSAVPSAQDYEINIAKTQAEYLDSCNEIEKAVHYYTEQAQNYFRMLELPKAKEAFEHVYSLKPNAYLFHAGITYFYLQDFHKAGNIFSQNANSFESKFSDMVATEERIWYMACELKLRSMIIKKEVKKLKMAGKLPIISNESLLQLSEERKETRKILRIAHDLFQATLENDVYTICISLTRLRLLANTIKTKRDLKQYKLQSLYYLGLYHDVRHQFESSKYYMKRALQLPETQNGMRVGDLMKCLPLLHMSKRDWFDDEEFQEQEEKQVKMIAELEMDVRDELMKDCEDFTVHSLQHALKKCHKKIIGSKLEIQSRLVDAVLDDIYKEEQF